MVIDLGYWTRVLKKIIVTAFIIIGLYFAFKLSLFYMPFLIAFIISVCIEPVIKWVKRKTNLTRKTSAIIVLVIVSAIIISLVIFGTIALIEEASKLLKGINTYYDEIYGLVQNAIQGVQTSAIQLPAEVQTMLESAVGNILVNVSTWTEGILEGFLDTLTSIPTISIYIGVTLLSIYFICTDRLYILDQIEHHLPRTWVKRLGKHIRELIVVLGGYLKAEIILIILAFVQVLIGLYIMKFAGLNVQYPLIAAIAVGFVDALPILGSGIILIPWAVISAATGDLQLGIWLVVLWIFISIVRQLIEPKIVSKQIGIHPIFTIIAMYTGLKLMGVIGLLIGPILLIILKNIFAKLIENGVFKTIFDRN